MIVVFSISSGRFVDKLNCPPVSYSPGSFLINHKVMAACRFNRREKLLTFFHFHVENTNVPEHLWHGDMIPNLGRAGHKQRNWPDGIVHYIYDPSIGEYGECIAQGLSQKHHVCLFV